jgi:hypothetical protein
VIEEPEQRKYEYCGPEEQPRRMSASGQSIPLSGEMAETIFRSTWERGRYHVPSDFKARCAELGVDLVDIENLIRDGRVWFTPKYDAESMIWSYRISGIVDERHIEVVIALDPAEDYADSPLAIFVTVREYGPNP